MAHDKPTRFLHYTEPALKAFQWEISCSQSHCWFSILLSCPRDVKHGAGRTHRTVCARMTASGWPGTCTAGHNWWNKCCPGFGGHLQHSTFPARPWNSSVEEDPILTEPFQDGGGHSWRSTTIAMLAMPWFWVLSCMLKLCRNQKQFNCPTLLSASCCTPYSCSGAAQDFLLTPIFVSSRSSPANFIQLLDFSFPQYLPERSALNPAFPHQHSASLGTQCLLQGAILELQGWSESGVSLQLLMAPSPILSCSGSTWQDTAKTETSTRSWKLDQGAPASAVPGQGQFLFSLSTRRDSAWHKKATMEWSWSDWEKLKATTETQGDTGASPRMLIPTQRPQHQDDLNPRDPKSPCLESNATSYPMLLLSPPYTHPFGNHTLASSSQHPAEPAFLRPPTLPSLFHHCVPAWISKCWTDVREFCVSWVSPCTGCVSPGVESSQNTPMSWWVCVSYGSACPKLAHIFRDGRTDEWEIK